MKYSNDDKKHVQLSHLVHDAIMTAHGIPNSVKKALQTDKEELLRHSQDNFFFNGCRVSEQLVLKENAQVMLLWNSDVKGGLANGSRGVVKGFFPTDGYLYLLKEEMKRREEEAKSDGDRLTQQENTVKPKLELPPSTYDFSSVNMDILEEVKLQVQRQTEEGLSKK